MLDPTTISAYGAIIIAIITAFNLNGRLKEERALREQLQEQLDIERKTRIDCLKEVAQLRGQVEALATMLQSRGLL